jgi:two-component system nitrogen regulation sensor histidine kinase GlnL
MRGAGGLMAPEAGNRSRASPGADIGVAVLDALVAPVIVVDGQDEVRYVNAAGEQFFGVSQAALLGHSLAGLLPSDSPVFALLTAVRGSGHPVTEYDVRIETPRIAALTLTIEAAPVVELPGAVVLSLQRESIALKLDHQLTHRNAARSVTAMAAMLAHEVKNPLSGIRGAAQLIEQEADPGTRQLTTLICEEADRIVALVNRMEMFSDDRPIERRPVNIHEVLDRVRVLAEAGFARGVVFKVNYDPSLPPVLGNRDLLIQAFLNLVKNAADAVPEDGGEILLETRFQQGIRLKVPGGGTRIDLPLVVSVQDNGSGIPEELRRHLFDAFVTTKSGGRGLGLALVAKIIGGHGGVIDLDSQPRRTVFRVALPTAPRAAATAATATALEGP